MAGAIVSFELCFVTTAAQANHMFMSANLMLYLLFGPHHIVFKLRNHSDSRGQVGLLQQIALPSDCFQQTHNRHEFDSYAKNGIPSGRQMADTCTDVLMDR